MRLPGNIIIILFTQAVSLHPSKKENINYYPLQTGNTWKYESLLVEFGDGQTDTISIDTITIKITGDTLMPNGISYYHVQGLDGGYRRYDTSTAQVYEYNLNLLPDSITEYILFDFSITDTIGWVDGLQNHITIKSSDQDKRAGRLDQYSSEKTFEGAYLYHKRVFSFGLGESYFDYGCFYPNSQNTLIQARINGVEYGPVSTIDKKYIVPQDFNVYDIYPNPFNESTQISFSLIRESYVKISIYNILGQQVEILIDDNMQPGKYQILWDASKNRSGIYIIYYRIYEKLFSKKCLLVK